MLEAQPLVNTKKFKIKRKILCSFVSKLRKLQYATPVTMYLIFKMDIQQYTNPKAWFKITTKAISITNVRTNRRIIE